MAKALDLVDITPQMRGWSCQVRIVKKFDEKLSTNTPGKRFMQILLEDKQVIIIFPLQQGIRVQAVVFDNDIPRYNSTLHLDSCYTISNANVKPQRPNYSVPDERYKYTWILSGRTVVQPLRDSSAFINASNKVYNTFYDVYHYMKSGIEISLMGIVIDKLPKEVIPTSKGDKHIKEIVLVDEKLKPIALTLWGDFADTEGSEIVNLLNVNEYPLISIENIGVTPFKGISLCTKPHSTVTINPISSRAQQLQKWAVENRPTLDALKICREYNNAAINLAIPVVAEISKISEVPPSIDPTKPVWIHGKINLQLEGDSLWYMACSNCLKTVYADSDTRFFCMHCGTEDAIATPRSRANVSITDTTSTIEASVFGQCVEKLLLMTSKQIMEVELQGKKASFQYANKRLDKEEYIVQLRSQSSTYQTNPGPSYTITSLHDASHYIVTTNIDPSTPPSSKMKLPHSGVEDSPVDLKRQRKTGLLITITHYFVYSNYFPRTIVLIFFQTL
ncbi:unnamed protein product [Cuscuta europaea]|nr:unnamed protein product [Cuscuta europaea]